MGDALKTETKRTGRLALKQIAAAAAMMAIIGTMTPASALSLGRLSVQSALGETLKADIDVTSLTPDEAANLRVKVAPPDAYRIAGVDYNPAVDGPRMIDEPGAVTSTVDIFVKDLDIVAETGRDARAPLPVAAAALQMFLAAASAGDGALDDSQVIRAYRRLMGG